MNISMTGWEAVLRVLLPMCTVICIGGAAILFLQSKGSRSRRLLAYIMLAWGLVYAMRTIGIVTGAMDFMKTDVLAPFVLIGGNLYVIVLLLYPLEVLRPGWLNLKRGLAILSPYLGIVGIYYIILSLLDQSPVPLRSWDDFLLNQSQFNVWYRLVILSSVVAYVVLLLCIVYRYEISYRKWCESNYASPEGMEVSWLRYYGIGVILIGVAYFCNVFDGNTYCHVFHNLTVQLFFGFTFYKGLFHENPYTENFFRHSIDEKEAEEDAEEKTAEIQTVAIDSEQPAPEKADPKIEEAIFYSKLPGYKMQVQQWLEETTPYTCKDFKLMDVKKVVPLNRTYLSQIFNEGWGTSFCNVIREYRIRHAERLLEQHPELTINEIAKLCGFVSLSTFHRAFASFHQGITPKQYQKEKNADKTHEKPHET